MKSENPLRDKSFAFSVKVAGVCFDIQKQHKEYVISKQLIKAATSIGANVEEAIGAHSEKDFYYKITIAHREARETNYWIRLLGELELISDTMTKELLKDIDELIKLSGSIQKTMRLKLKNKVKD
ncbi:MAG: four helix bundle protein [Vicingaceae bacterium]